jgi:hypothetical protein
MNSIKILKQRNHILFNLLVNSGWHVIIPILFGSLIYIAYRPKSLLVFNWLNALQLSWFVSIIRNFLGVIHAPYFILYSLPDGLWVYSFSYCCFLIWNNKLSSYQAFFWIFLPFCIGIGSEFLQLFNIIQGTFSISDIIAYIGALSLIIFQYFQGRKNELS